MIKTQLGKKQKKKNKKKKNKKYRTKQKNKKNKKKQKKTKQENKTIKLFPLQSRALFEWPIQHNQQGLKPSTKICAP